MIKKVLYIISLSLLFAISCAKETSLASGTSASQPDVKEYLLSVTGCPNGSGCNGWVGISFPNLKQQSIQGREAIVGSLPAGIEVTISATPAEGFQFHEWSNGVTSNPITFKLNSDIELTAVFKATDD